MTAISEDKLETTYVDQSNKLRDLFIQHYGLNVGSDRVLVDNTILTIDKFEPRRYLYEARIVDISVTPLNNNNLYNVKFSLVSTGHTYLITAHPELKKECQETKFYEGTVHFMYFSFRPDFSLTDMEIEPIGLHKILKSITPYKIGQ